MRTKENLRGIKSWSEDDRPREKMMQKGVSALSNAELLAILIATGTQEHTALDLAKLLLANNGDSFGRLAHLSVAELASQVKGIGSAKSVTIAAALEIGRRRAAETPLELQPIQSSAQAAAVFSPMLMDLPHEEFWVLLLSRANKPLAKYRVGMGGVHATPVDVRIILKHAVVHLAAGMVLCHNHPSGTKKPSSADIQLTQQIIKAATALQVNVLDHIIITPDGYFSFSDEQILNR